MQKEHIEAFLAALNQSYVTDSTNLADDYTRNFFRHKVLPLLKQVNPSLESGLCATSRVLRETQIFLEKTANNSLTDRVAELALQDEVLLRQSILLLYRKSGANGTPEYVHINAIAALVREAADNGPQTCGNLPAGGMSACICDGIPLV